jgi:hypothetical protein
LNFRSPRSAQTEKGAVQLGFFLLMGVDLRRLIGKLNPTTRAALESAAGLCVSRTNYEVALEHLLARLVESGGADFGLIIKRFGIDVSILQRDIDRSVELLKKGNDRSPAISSSLFEALAVGWLYGSIDYDAQSIRSGFIVVALLAEEWLSRLIFAISPTFQQIDISLLRRELAAIVASSVEDAETQTGWRGDGASSSTGPRVFISYRRRASDLHATILHERLAAAVPGISVFRDRDSLLPGVLYAEEIHESIKACDIVLALIDEQWLRAKDDQGRRRLDDPGDWVRLELAAALSYEKTIVPCLIGKARLPAKGVLPPDLANLEQRQAIRFSKEMSRIETEPLIQIVRKWSSTQRRQPS